MCDTVVVFTAQREVRFPPEENRRGRAAWVFVKTNGMKLGDAMRCAYRNLKLKTGMLAGKAMRFTFAKAANR